jgi:hypothetical protein
MAINLSDNIKVNAPKPVESKYLNITVPYTGSSQVNSCISLGERYPGLTVNVNNVDYWYHCGVLDTCLIEKINAGTLTGATNGIKVLNNGKTVSLGGDLTTGTTINGLGLHNINFSNINGFDISTSGNTTEIIIEPAGITLSYSGITVSLDSVNGLTYGNHYTYNEFSLPDKEYVDAIANGLTPKEAVLVATTTNLTYPFSGLTIIDGVSLSNGNRVLIKDQSSSGQTNGIWIASASTWTRSDDFDGIPSGETKSGAYMWVLSGNTNAQTSWVLITPNPIHIHNVTGTSLTFALYNHVKDVIAGTGITVTTITGTHIVSLNTTTQAILNSTITGVTNIGGGESVYSGTSGHNFILNTFIGSGITTVQKVGNEIIIYSNLNNVCVNYTTSNPYTITACTGYLGVSGASCIYLPSLPNRGRKVIVEDICGNALSSPITVDGNGKSVYNNSYATINTNYGSITFLYNGLFWSAVAFVN